ncbi:MAG TPA: hypothetical protein VGK45_16720 [Thermoanaerobaculia bacterium]
MYLELGAKGLQTLVGPDDPFGDLPGVVTLTLHQDPGLPDLVLQPVQASLYSAQASIHPVQANVHSIQAALDPFAHPGEVRVEIGLEL